MKKLLQVLLPVLVLGVVFSGCGRKATPAENYSYKMDSGEVTISGYHGTEREIVIPEEIEERPVTRIGENAFRDYDLTSIDFPDSLLVIEYEAFSGCDCLESISFGKNLEQIGSNAFSDCVALQKVSLPEGVTEIGDHAFEDCTSLQSVSLPNKLEEIGHAAFYGCTSLERISMPESLKVIDASAFSGCNSLQSVELNKGLQYLGAYSFNNCTSLRSVELNEGLQYLGEGSFGGCANMEKLELPDDFDGFAQDYIPIEVNIEANNYSVHMSGNEMALSPVLEGSARCRGEGQCTVLVVKEGSRAQSLLDEVIEYLGDSNGYRYITK